MTLKQTDLAAVKATPAYKWAMESVGGKSTQCEFVKLAADRFLRDLKRKDITFDVDEYARLNRYYSMFLHTKGLLKGERFILRPDQQFVVGQLVAWKYRETGERRFTDAYKEVARKNGKSWEAGGLAGYHLTSAGESEAEVYTLATSEKQAGESWKAFRSMSRTCPKYAKTLEYRTGEIRHPKSGGIFQPLPSTGENLDGKNPSFIITDEYHLFRQVHDESRASLRGGGGARKNIIEYKITTGGSNTFGSCYEERQRAINVLRGTIDLDMYLPIVFTLDKGDDWTDERNWHKANPALGISKSLKFMRNAFALTQQSARAISEFKTKQLDLWTNEVSAWLSVDDWRALEKKLPEETLAGKRCIVGMDLGETNDLTAFAILFPPQDGLDKWYLRMRFFVPQIGAIVRESNKVPYFSWATQGFMTFSGEKRVEMRQIAADMLKDLAKYDVQFLAYDAWKSNVIVEAFKGAGIDCRPIKQYYQQLSPASCLFAELIDRQDILHDGNPCMAFCVGNVVVDSDPNGNIKPNKKRSSEKIDGVAATIDALAGYIMETQKESEKIIEDCPVHLF